MAAAPPFGPLDARRALVDLLNALQSPPHRAGLEAARAEADDDMVRHMRLVFPLATAVQAEVVARYGFSPDGEGVVQFIQHVKAYEREDPEVARLHQLVKAHFIPPMQQQQQQHPHQGLRGHR